MAQRYRMTWHGSAVKAAARANALAGLRESLEFVLTESNKAVPLDEGTLMRSGTTSVDEANLRGAVSYDTPYAVRQHEEVTWRHSPGRTAKYLENAVNSNQQQIAAIMQSHFRGWLS